MHDFGHPVTFNEYVGDTDKNGNRVDRQFWYYPNAQPTPVLTTDGGDGASDAAMQEESLDGMTVITANTEHELLAYYWQATAHYREHHDAVARGEKPVAETPDGNPPREEMPPPTPPNMNGRHFTQEDAGPMPPIGGIPTTEAPPPTGLPTVEVDLPTFIQMQRQLIMAEFQPLIDLQEMVIQTHAILLSDSLDPGSPHHAIMESWMSKLEEMRLNLYADTGNTEHAEAAD